MSAPAISVAPGRSRRSCATTAPPAPSYEFVQRGQLTQPHAVIFGPDGNLYVGDRVEVGHGRIARFDGVTGAYLDDFVPVLSGGLAHPLVQVFGPSGRG